MTNEEALQLEINRLREKIEQLNAEIDDMQEDVDFLACLEAQGVDNWSGYEFAQEMYREDFGYEED